MSATVRVPVSTPFAPYVPAEGPARVLVTTLPVVVVATDILSPAFDWLKLNCDVSPAPASYNRRFCTCGTAGADVRINWSKEVELIFVLIVVDVALDWAPDLLRNTGKNIIWKKKKIW